MVKGINNILSIWKDSFKHLFSAITDLQISPLMAMDSLDRFVSELSKRVVTEKREKNRILQARRTLQEQLEYYATKNVVLLEAIQEELENRCSRTKDTIANIDKLKNEKILGFPDERDRIKIQKSNCGNCESPIITKAIFKSGYRGDYNKVVTNIEKERISERLAKIDHELNSNFFKRRTNKSFSSADANS